MTLHRWQEDTLYGRYEVTLTVDCGTVNAAMGAADALEEFAQTLGDTFGETLPVLGYSVQTTNLIGMRQKRLRS